MAKDVLITGLSDEELAAVDSAAAAQGMNRLTWIRKILTEQAQAPVVKERYAYKFFKESASGTLKRYSDHLNGTTATYANCTQEQVQAADKAKLYALRNQPGDREKAVALLQGAFDEVFEVPV